MDQVQTTPEQRLFLFVRFQWEHETLFDLIHNPDRSVLNDVTDKYAEGLARKYLAGLSSIRRLIEAKPEWESSLHDQTFYFDHDPEPVLFILRSLYEVLLTFNHVFVNPPTKEERQVRYLFWRLETPISRMQASYTDSHEIAEGNQRQINELVDELLSMSIIKTLDVSSQKIITDKRLAKSDQWAYIINGDKLEKVGGFLGMQSRLRITHPFFQNTYKVLSLNAHPTAASAHTAMTMYNDSQENPENVQRLDALLSYAISFNALFIHDYCQHFSDANQRFSKLPAVYRALIEESLRAIKTDLYSSLR